MDFTYRTLQRIYKKGAVPLLSLSVSLPHLTEEGAPFERINAFYREMEQRIVTVAEEKLYPALLRQYGEGEEQGGRFSHSPHRLSLSTVCRKEGDHLACERRLSLSHRGRTVRESIHREAIFPSGLLLPLRAPKKKAARRDKKEKTRE